MSSYFNEQKFRCCKQNSKVNCVPILIDRSWYQTDILYYSGTQVYIDKYSSLIKKRIWTKKQQLITIKEIWHYFGIQNIGSLS